MVHKLTVQQEEIGSVWFVIRKSNEPAFPVGKRLVEQFVRKLEMDFPDFEIVRWPPLEK